MSDIKESYTIDPKELFKLSIELLIGDDIKILVCLPQITKYIDYAGTCRNKSTSIEKWMELCIDMKLGKFDIALQKESVKTTFVQKRSAKLFYGDICEESDEHVIESYKDSKNGQLHWHIDAISKQEIYDTIYAFMHEQEVESEDIEHTISVITPLIEQMLSEYHAIIFKDSTKLGIGRPRIRRR